MEEQLHRQQLWVPNGTDLSPDKAETSSGKPRKRQTWSFGQVAEFVQAYPLLVWGGIWVSILLVAAIAVGGLLSPGMTEGRRATGAAFGSSATVDGELAAGDRKVPFWLFGAIAISCTAGSILVSKRLSREQSPRPISRPKRTKAYAAVVSRPKKTRKSPQSSRKPAPPRRQQSSSVQPGSRLKRLKPFAPEDFAPIAAPPAASPMPAPVPPQKPRSFQVSPPSSGTPRKAKPGAKPTTAGVKSAGVKSAPQKPAQVPVTILPPEENHPLDWQDTSLADAMDIRKRHSWSSWM